MRRTPLHSFPPYLVSSYGRTPKTLERLLGSPAGQGANTTVFTADLSSPPLCACLQITCFLQGGREEKPSCPCMKDTYGLRVCALAGALVPTRVLPWFGYPSGLCPCRCSGALLLRFPWETLTWVWAFAFVQEPHLAELTGTSFLPKPPPSLEEISHQLQSH